jgi:2-keto-4-pentenoate hydratase/2-oxohepta-3-ene-1,7-dioic acid hydratase in catechol pathway
MTDIYRYEIDTGERFYGTRVGNAGAAVESTAVEPAAVELATAQRWSDAPWRSSAAKALAQQDQVVRWLPPVEPPAVYCIGLNYAAHAAESGAAIPQHPVVFMKPPSALCGAGEAIVLPPCSSRVDYECELAVMIGREAKNVAEADALGVVAGYVVANDISARDWQKDYGGGQWIRGKSFDSFCPIGPAVTLVDAVPDPQQLTLTTHIDGEQRQHGHSSDMIFSVAHLVSFLSQSTTLQPGTLILTGTPPGVAMGMAEPQWLASGQQVRCAISGLQSLVNPVMDERTP